MHISLPSHKYLMASAAVEGLLTVVSLPTIHWTSQLLCGCQASIKAMRSSHQTLTVYLWKAQYTHRAIQVRQRDCPPVKLGPITVVLQVKSLPVSQQHELSGQRNSLTSEIAVCVPPSTSHPVYVTWKTACEQEITLPGYEGAGAKQGKEVKSTAKLTLFVSQRGDLECKEFYKGTCLHAKRLKKVM